VRYWDVIGFDRICHPDSSGLRGEMGHDLMTIQIEIDPGVRTSALFAAEQAAIKLTRRCEVANGEGKVK
jgi:hypothetical protein